MAPPPRFSPFGSLAPHSMEAPPPPPGSGKWKLADGIQCEGNEEE